MSIHPLDRTEEDVNSSEQPEFVYPCPCGRVQLRSEHLMPEDWARCGSCGQVHMIPTVMPKPKPRVPQTDPDGSPKRDPLSHLPLPLPHRRAVSPATTNTPASRWDSLTQDEASTHLAHASSKTPQEPSTLAAATWLVVGAVALFLLLDRSINLTTLPRFFLTLFFIYSVYMMMSPIRARSRRKRLPAPKRGVAPLPGDPSWRARQSEASSEESGNSSKPW